MNRTLFPVLMTLTFVLVGCDKSFEPKRIFDCNRTYYETAYETTWTSTEDASLDYNRWSGKIKFTPQSKKENQAEVAWGMDTDKFFSLCSSGNRGVWSTACSHFQNCVSVVKNIENPNREEFVSLDFRGTAEFIKQKLYSEGKTEPREDCNGSTCWMKYDKITEACDAVVNTYSATTVGDAIFKNIPELDYDQSQELGKKAVGSYGSCNCVLHNALGRKNYNDMSIGYCVGDKYVQCKSRREGEGAFCGRNIAR